MTPILDESDEWDDVESELSFLSDGRTYTTDEKEELLLILINDIPPSLELDFN